MKIKISELPENSCFRSGKRVVKKLSDGRCAWSDKKGRTRRGKCPSTTAETAICPLSLLGAGLPPERTLIEMGSPAEPRKRRR